jgi:hypothetical protein
VQRGNAAEPQARRAWMRSASWTVRMSQSAWPRAAIGPPSGAAIHPNALNIIIIIIIIVAMLVPTFARVQWRWATIVMAAPPPGLPGANSYDRMTYIASLSACSGDGHSMTDPPTARSASGNRATGSGMMFLAVDVKVILAPP